MNSLTDLTVDRVIVITVDCLRWDHHEKYRDLYPNGIWYRGTPQATSTPMSHAAMLTGVNPPRNGVHDFGDVLYMDNLLNNIDSSATFNDTIADVNSEKRGMLPVYNANFDEREKTILAPDQKTIDDQIWQFNSTNRENVSKIGEYDFSHLHDWIVHGSGTGYDVWWGENIDQDNTVEENNKIYGDHVDFSIKAHRKLIDTLKDENLYENTLFVVWGDHGQGFGEAPTGQLGHNHRPSENVSRVPIAFCHSDIEDTVVDTTTNARGVDIAPTVMSIIDGQIEYSEFSHELEGVDLTEFEGELAGYTMCVSTTLSGRKDGVRSSSEVYIKSSNDFTAETDVDTCTMRRCEPTFGHEKLKNLRGKFRNDVTKGILTQEPNKEMMKELGYL